MGKNEDYLINENDPFVAARAEAAERYGHLAKNAAQWRLMSIVLLLCCVACVFVTIYKAGQVIVVPYIVQVDEHGYVSDLIPVEPPLTIEQRLIIDTIRRYIWSLTTVFLDREAQSHLIRFVHNFSAISAQARYVEHYEANNPRDAMKTRISNHTVVNSVLPLSSTSENTWLAEWTEYAVQEGRIISTKYYRGNFTTAVNTPNTMAAILENPLGIYITNFNFSEIVGGQSR